MLLVENEGTVTLAEAKLKSNSEIRRAVVGQLLGYAGGLWGLRYDDLDALVRARQGAPLAHLARAASDDEQFDADAFRDQVAENLRVDAFRLVFVVDQITWDLRRAVEYLNAHLDDALEVRVLELGYAKLSDVKVLVPQTFGEESARRKQQTRTGRAWTGGDFYTAVDEHATPQHAALVRRLLARAEPKIDAISSGAGQLPSATLVFKTSEGCIQPRTVTLNTVVGTADATCPQGLLTAQEASEL